MPDLRLRSSTVSCSTYPSTTMTGSAAAKAMNAETPVCSTITNITYAPKTAMSPCARLMIRITPNMIESPQASTA